MFKYSGELSPIMTQNSYKTPEIIPLVYGPIKRTRDRITIIPPSQFMQGAAIIKTKKQLEEQLHELKESIQKGEYEPILLNIDDISALNPETLETAIKKAQGTYNLWRIGGEKAVTNLQEHGIMISAQVKSMGRGRGAYRNVRISAPDQFGQGNFGRLYSDSKFFMWGITKEAGGKQDLEKRIEQGESGMPLYNVVDSYIAAALIFWANKNRTTDLLPVLLHNNPLLEMLVSHYLDNKTLFEIDKALVDKPGVINPSLVQAVEKGDLTVGVMRQRKTKREIDPGVAYALIHLNNHFRKEMRQSGYRPIGYAIEFKNTPAETVAEVWKSGRNYKSLLFNKRFPPIVITRTVHDNKAPDFYDDMSFELPSPREIIMTKFLIRPYDLLRRDTGAYFYVPRYADRLVDLRSLYQHPIPL
jgi:hypothetical protein